jgi:hypothetical protein
MTLRLLRGEQPFAAVQLFKAFVWFDPADDPAESEATTRAICAALPAASSASTLCLELGNAQLDVPGLLAHVVDCALASRLRGVRLATCSLPDAAETATQLVRLLDGGVQSLSVQHGLARGVDPAATAVLCAALARSRCLSCFKLRTTVQRAYATSVESVVSSLMDHPTLTELELELHNVDKPASRLVGRSIGRLIEANAPQLRSLSLAWTELDGDASVAIIAAALARNTHLRSLDLRHMGYSDAFLRKTLLPAIRLNTGICLLRVTSIDPAVHALFTRVMRLRAAGLPSVRRSERHALRV